MNDIELLAADLPPQRWAIEGLLPEGVTVFIAPGKTGKSFFALNIACDIAYGDKTFDRFPASTGDVLFLALEDSPLRCQLRLQLLLAARDRVPNGRLHVETTWQRADDGGLEAIENWLSDFPNARLVVVDVLRKFHSIRGWSTEDEYHKIEAIGNIAVKHNVSILLVHHENRTGNKKRDWTERGQGTMALRDAAHCMWGLERDRGAAISVFRAVGKDVPDTAIPLDFDPGRGTFMVVDDPNLILNNETIVPMSDERAEIFKIVERNSGCNAVEIAKALGRPYGNVRHLLWSMKQQHQLINLGGAYYTPKQITEMGKDDDPQLAFVEQPTAVLTAR